MIEKRSIDEIIKSIFLLVSEAKQKNEQLEKTWSIFSNRNAEIPKCRHLRPLARS